MKKGTTSRPKKRYTSQEREKMFKPTYFFGYGKLLNVRGINQKGMRHNYIGEELYPAMLHGFKRGMSGYFEDFGPPGRNFYGLLPSRTARCNGVIFKIHSWADYRQLLHSEGGTSRYGAKRCYWPVDVADKIRDIRLHRGVERLASSVIAGHRVMALVCRADNTGKGRVFGDYIEFCWHAANEWGPKFAEEFVKTGGVRGKIEWGSKRRR